MATLTDAPLTTKQASAREKPKKSSQQLEKASKPKKHKPCDGEPKPKKKKREKKEKGHKKEKKHKKASTSKEITPRPTATKNLITTFDTPVAYLTSAPPPEVVPTVNAIPSTSEFLSAKALLTMGHALQPPMHTIKNSELPKSQGLLRVSPFVTYKSLWEVSLPCLLFVEPKIPCEDSLRSLEIVQDLIFTHNVIAGLSEHQVFCVTPTEHKASLLKRLELADLKVRASAELGVASGVMENALQTYVTMSLAEQGWHKAGDFYAHGDLFSKEPIDLDLVRMEIHLSADCREVSTSISPSIGRTAPFSAEAIVGSEKLMKEFDRGLEVVKGQIGSDQKLCTVLPGLQTARIESVSKRVIGSGGQFAKFEDFRRYWRLTHLYDLPPTQEYISVKFSECGMPLTYPSCCVWSPLGMPELRTRVRVEGERIGQKMLASLQTLKPEGGAPFAKPQVVAAAIAAWRKCCPFAEE